MKQKIILSSIIAASFFLTACGSSGNDGNKNGNGGGNHGNKGNGGVDVNSYPTYSLTQQNKNDLAFMGNEERLAYNVYMNLYNYHNNNGNEIKQLYNISSGSEVKHIETVRDLVNKYNIKPEDLTVLDSAPVASSTTDQSDLPDDKYGVAHIQTLYNDLMAKGESSVQDALEVGCMIEVTDINDLNPKIQNAIDSGAKDLEDAFSFLRDGSYNHYWAFDKGLKNLGIDDGCCSLGDEWCHNEYPKK